MRVASLADLGIVQAQRAAAARAEDERQRQLQEAQRLAREAQRRAERERQFFAESVGPVTRLPLVYDRAANELISKKARLAYPIRGGIPIMLEEEARDLDEEPAAPAGEGA